MSFVVAVRFEDEDSDKYIKRTPSGICPPCQHVKYASRVVLVCQHIISVHLRQKMVYLEIRTLYKKPLISQINSNVNHMARNKECFILKPLKKH